MLFQLLLVFGTAHCESFCPHESMLLDLAHSVFMGLRTGPIVPEYSSTVLYRTFLANGQPGAGALEHRGTELLLLLLFVPHLS